MAPMQNCSVVACPVKLKNNVSGSCISITSYHPLSTTQKMIMASDDADGPKQCAVCGRSALCYNFGVLSCDACKMFFRRTMVLNVKYECRRNNQCFEKNFSCLTAPYCRACRFTQCVKVGMRLTFSNFIEIKNDKDDNMAKIIGGLLYQDSKREKALITHFTFDNPSLEDIVESRKCLVVLRDPSYNMTSEDWCFFGAYTAVKFLLSLNFMKNLRSQDKLTLLANFSAKATLLFSAIRTMKAKNDKMIKPDGNDFFIEFLSKWSHFSLHFTNRVRSLLVNRLIELNITNEEFILVTVVFFCNPALDNLSEEASAILGKEQKVYSDALMKYCLNTYQQAGPARFTDLLGLCHVTNKYFVDVQYLYWIFQFQFHVQYKKLVAGVI